MDITKYLHRINAREGHPWSGREWKLVTDTAEQDGGYLRERESPDSQAAALLASTRTKPCALQSLKAHAAHP